MMSAPAGLEEVINYADFKQEASLESIEDESTLEDEPDEQDLEDLMAGNITLNASRTIILPPGEYINSLFFSISQYSDTRSRNNDTKVCKNSFIVLLRKSCVVNSKNLCLPSTLWSLDQLLVSFIVCGSQRRCLTLI